MTFFDTSLFLIIATSNFCFAGLLIWLDGELRARRSHWTVPLFAIGVFISASSVANKAMDEALTPDWSTWLIVLLCLIAATFSSVTFFLYASHKLGWRRSLEEIRARRAAISTSQPEVARELENRVSARTRELVEANSRLVEGEAYFRRLYRSTPTMMHSLGPDGEIAEVSDQWLRVMGYTAEQVIGRRPSDFMDKTSPSVPQTISLTGQDADSLVVTRFHRYRTKGGEIVEVEESTVPELDVLSGLKSHSVLVDVTQRNEAVKALETKSVSLERANNSLRQFAYIASHDLQEPLRKIASFTDFLRLSLESGDQNEVKYAMEVLSNASVRARALVTDLLTYSRISNQDIEQVEVDLPEILQMVMAEVADSVQEVGGQLTYQLDPMRVSADRAQVKSLFVNLLTNAVKYRSDDRPLKIEVAGQLTANAYEITVADNGIGFDAKYAKTVFEPFRRLHSHQVIKGTGIGLAICSSVVERHGWRIEAAPELGKGVTFTVTIPVKEGQAIRAVD